jgi:hypothetical protein
MPGLDRVENDCGTILVADDSGHGTIIACRHGSWAKCLKMPVSCGSSCFWQRPSGNEGKYPLIRKPASCRARQPRLRPPAGSGIRAFSAGS